MFTTHRDAELHLEPNPDHAGTQLWSYVEQEILWPWLYLQVARSVNETIYRSVIMFHHAHDLKRILDQQSYSGWVEQVQLVSPPHINGGKLRLMEPLEEIRVVAKTDSSESFYYRVTNGMCYSNELNHNIHGPVVVDEILFSAKNHLFYKKNHNEPLIQKPLEHFAINK